MTGAHRLEVGEQRAVVGAGEREEKPVAFCEGSFGGKLHSGWSSVVVAHLTAEGTTLAAQPDVER
jgi:hypothetical protein